MAEKVTGLQTYKRLLRYTKKQLTFFYIAVVGMVLYAGADAGFVYLMKPLMDDGFVNRDSKTMFYVPVALAVLVIIRAVASFLSNYFMAMVARNVIYSLREDIFKKLLLLPARYYDKASTGDLVSKVTFNTEQVANAASVSMTVIIRDGIGMLFFLGLLFYYSWVLTCFVFIVGPIIAVLTTWVSKHFRRYAKRIQESMGGVTNSLSEAIAGRDVVRLYGGKDSEADKFSVVNEQNRKQQLKLALVQHINTPVVHSIFGLMIAAIVALAIYDPFGESISAGTFTSYLFGLIAISQPVRRLANINSPLQRGIAAGESIFELLDEQTERNTGTARPDPMRGKLEFQGVSHRYDNAELNALNNISLRLEAGKTVAFVGRSGSGKTTLVGLLARFYDASAGTILVDDVAIQDIELDYLRSQIAYVGQNVTLFDDTVMRNIAYGISANASMTAIRNAARAAHCLEFIEALPKGFDTRIGENSSLLSGGQRQRLVIARALLKDAPILILDEATSALDSESERHIQDALKTLIQGRTTLMIAHRLATIEAADTIVVMEGGEIIETGSHVQLIAHNGQYANLHRLQFKS